MKFTMKHFLKIGIPFLIAGVVFFLALFFLNQNSHAVKGALVAGVEIRNLPKVEAQQVLEEGAEDYMSSTIKIGVENGSSIQVSPQEMGISIHTNKPLEDAYGIGKKGPWYKNLITQAKSLFFGSSEPLGVDIDYNIMAHFVRNKLNSAMHNPAKNASYTYNTDTEEFEFVPASNGRVVDVYKLQTIFVRHAENLSKEDIALEQTNDTPDVTEDTNEQALKQAQDILSNAPYTINANGQSWEIEKGDLISWINFVPVWDDELGKNVLTAELSKNTIREYLRPFAPGLSNDPVNGRFRMEGDKVVEFDLAQPGRELNVSDSASALSANIKSLRKVTELIFNETQPAISSENIDSLGINALVGSGTTNFAGSPNSRVHNIRVGSDRYQGVLIAPGEEFSFNQQLGPVNASTGYLPELVIKRGATVPEYGGGLCQVSTTLFRAAVFAGLEITKRSNHSYPVVYYGEPGFDATIYPPNPDLAFKNNTPGHILIQYSIVGTQLTFEIYGQDDGRIVEVDGPYTYDWQSNGAVKAWLTQTVKNDNGTVLFEKTFHSNYRSPSLYPVSANPLE